MYNKRNSLRKNHLMSLKKLKIKKQKKDIVIGYSDTHGKTIIIDYDDYTKIINQSLDKNFIKLPYNKSKIKEIINKNKEEMNKLVMNMCENNIIMKLTLYLV